MEREGLETASFEDAARCPKCGHPGEIDANPRPGPNRSKIHLIYCRNPVCRWLDTNWVVQQLEDGTVPVRKAKADEPRRAKSFPKLPGTREQYLKGLERSDDESLPPDATSGQS